MRFLMLFAVAACTDTDPTGSGTADTGTPPTADGADVYELAIRRLGEGQDVAAFEAARDAFVAQLREQPGVSADREFSAFFDFSTFAEPTPPVFSGMTQYDDLAAVEAAGAALGASPEAGAFFATFTPELFTLLRPLDPDADVDLDSIAAGPGQVLEIAYRDLSAYEDFDAAAYAAARDDLLALLAAQDGVVAEFQWVGAVDPNIAVGMTVYADVGAFLAIAQDPAVAYAPEAAAFLGTYPPMGGFVHAVVR